jgi:hypothetical protein
MKFSIKEIKDNKYQRKKRILITYKLISHLTKYFSSKNNII